MSDCEHPHRPFVQLPSLSILGYEMKVIPVSHIIFALSGLFPVRDDERWLSRSTLSFACTYRREFVV
ncbi:hypothetical protein M9458_016692, partial [Cirrhinus mrigala]